MLVRHFDGKTRQGSEKCREFNRCQVLDIQTWDALKGMTKITEMNSHWGQIAKRDEKNLKDRLLGTQEEGAQTV